MVTQLRYATRRARKEHSCSLCNGLIAVGEEYHVSTNAWDGLLYDWKTCQGCRGLTGIVHEWWGYPDEGIGTDSADDWAHEMLAGASVGPHELERARAYLTRRACKCEQCRPEEVGP